MVTDTIADTLTRLKNSVERKKEVSLISDNKMNRYILDILVKEGFIESYSEVEGGIEVILSYNDGGEPVVMNFKKVSKPGQRIYVGSNDIVPVMNGRGISIISTSKGIMTGAQAKSQGVGGEYICNIW